MFITCKFEIYNDKNKKPLASTQLLYLIFHQQNIAHDRKCMQYYSVRRAVIPFTDCGIQTLGRTNEMSTCYVSCTFSGNEKGQNSPRVQCRKEINGKMEIFSSINSCTKSVSEAESQWTQLVGYKLLPSFLSYTLVTICKIDMTFPHQLQPTIILQHLFTFIRKSTLENPSFPKRIARYQRGIGAKQARLPGDIFGTV